MQLFRAAQVAIIIDDVALALLVIIQLGAAPIAAVGWATRFQIIAIHVDFLAALSIRTNRRASQRAANSSGHAAQIAILIHDLAVALSVIIDTGVLPVAVHCFATSFQPVTMTLDVLAALGVWCSHHANRSAIATRDYR